MTSTAVHNAMLDALRRWYAERMRVLRRHPLALAYLRRCARWSEFLDADPGRFRRHLERPAELRQDRADRMRGYAGAAEAFGAAVTDAHVHVSPADLDGRTLTVRLVGELLATPAGLLEALRRAERVTVHVDSPGGVIDREILATLEAVPDSTAFIQHGGSGSALIALATKHRVIAPTGSFLIHSAVTACLGDAQALRAQARELDRQHRLDAQFIARRTGQSRRTVKRWLSGGDYYFDPQAALRFGLVHQIDPDPK